MRSEMMFSKILWKIRVFIFGYIDLPYEHHRKKDQESDRADFIHGCLASVHFIQGH